MGPTASKTSPPTMRSPRLLMLMAAALAAGYAPMGKFLGAKLSLAFR